MAFSDPYFAIKASLSSTISDLAKAKDEIITPLIHTAMIRQQRLSRQLTHSSPMVDPSSSLVVDTAEIKKHLDVFEEDFSSVEKSLRFCDNMLVAIRSGEAGGRNFPPGEILARQRFVEKSISDAESLRTFLNTSRAIEADLASGKLTMVSNRGSPMTANGLLAPPPILNATGGVMPSNLTAAAEREAAKARAKAAAEEAHFNDNEAFMQAQRQIQREEYQMQEAALDRIARHVGDIRESVINVGEEMDSQDTMLNEQIALADQVRNKLAATTAKINTLMENMSNRGKICTIVVLLMVLSFLIVLSF